MTPELPPNPRAELEARVTALLLGELSADEAASVSELIAHDAELSRLHQRLSLTLDLLSETIATPIGQTPAAPVPLKLSPARREKLLAHFKTIAPEEFANPPRRKISWLIPLAAAAAIALMVPLFLSSLARSKKHAQMTALDLQSLAVMKRTAPPVSASAPPPASPAPSGIVLPQSDERLLARQNTEKIDGITRSVNNFNDSSAAVIAGTRSKHAETQLPLVAPATPVTVSSASRGAVVSTLEAGRNGPDDSDIKRAWGNSAPGRNVTLKDATVEGQPQEQSAAIGGKLVAANSPAPNIQTIVNSGLLADSQIPRSAFSFNNEPKDKLVTMEPLRQQSEQSAPVEKPVPTYAAERMARGMDTTTHTKNRSVAITPIPESIGALAAASAPPPAAGDSLKLGVDRAGNTSTDATEIPAASTIAASAAPATPAAPSKKQSALNDAPLPHPALPAPVPQTEILTRKNAFNSFSLNVSDVAFKLAAASLQNGVMPEAASMRSEDFINAFDYRDPEPAPGAPIGFAWERAGDPFAHHRDLLRLSIKTAAQRRQMHRPLNLVLMLDESASMERADRVKIVAQALRVLAAQLQPHDTLSVVVFARTARLRVDGVPGNQADKVINEMRDLTPEDGTNLEDAMKLACATALRHYLANGENRVLLMTDGAANLGNVEPNALKQTVETNRKQGIALDCFGIGWDGYNDNMLETLSRAGNGRYGFINTPKEAATEFVGKLAGALRAAAADVKVQVEFNPNRVTSYRQIGYAQDQLKKEDSRDNNVKAAQIGAAETGNALYTVEINPSGAGPLGTVRMRFRVPGASDYQEHEWTMPYTGSAVPLEKASPAMRLAATAAEFSEWLSASPYAGTVTPDRLLFYLHGVPQVYGTDGRPAKLEWMIRQAKNISGK